MSDAQQEQDTGSININTLKRNELDDIALRVGDAFDNRLKVEFRKVGEQSISEVDLQQAREENDWLNGLRDDEYVTFGPYTPSKHEVVVTNSHMYPKLIQFAYETLEENDQIPKTPLPELIEEATKNEHEHIQSIEGDPGVKLYYGVSFKEDSATGRVKLGKFCAISGKIMCRDYKELLSDPNRLSPSDKIKAGQISL